MCRLQQSGCVRCCNWMQIMCCLQQWILSHVVRKREMSFASKRNLKGPNCSQNDVTGSQSDRWRYRGIQPIRSMEIRANDRPPITKDSDRRVPLDDDNDNEILFSSQQQRGQKGTTKTIEDSWQTFDQSMGGRKEGNRLENDGEGRILLKSKIWEEYDNNRKDDAVGRCYSNRWISNRMISQTQRSTTNLGS